MRKPGLVEMLPSPEEVQRRMEDLQGEIRLLRATLKLTRQAAEQRHQEVINYAEDGRRALGEVTQ